MSLFYFVCCLSVFLWLSVLKTVLITAGGNISLCLFVSFARLVSFGLFKVALLFDIPRRCVRCRRLPFDKAKGHGRWYVVMAILFDRNSRPGPVHSIDVFPCRSESGP